MSDPTASERASAPSDHATPADSFADDVGRVVWIPGEFDEQAWRRSAACRDTDPELFFPIGLTGDAVPRIAHAKAICRDCPVRLVCLQYALVSNQEFGVWGGYDEEERRDLRRKWRRRGRPERFVPGASLDRVVPLDRPGPSGHAPEAG